MTIEAYLAKIKSISDNLAAINHPILESELVTRTLNGLPNTLEYQPVVFAIENRETRASSSRFGDANHYDDFSRFGDSDRYDNRDARNFSRSQGSGRDTPRCQIY